MSSSADVSADEAGEAAGVPPRSTRSRRRRLAYRCASMGFAVILALILGELVLRAYLFVRGWTPNCYAGTVQLLVPDAANGYRLASGFHLRSSAYEITTNRHGLRGPELAESPSDDVTRIAVLGGSSVFGYLVSDDDVACRLLEHNLREAGHNVEVLNGGVPGYNLFQTTQRFESTIAPLEPDLVILYLGWNDLPYVTSCTPDAERFQRGRVAPAWERLLSRSTLFGLIRYRLLPPPAPAFAPPPEVPDQPTAAGARQFHENLERLAEAARTSGAELMVCSQATAANPQASEGARRYLGDDESAVERSISLATWLHAALSDFSSEQGAVFIDAYSRIPPTEEFLGDAIHLTAAGEQALAELLFEHLQPVLSQADTDEATDLGRVDFNPREGRLAQVTGVD